MLDEEEFVFNLSLLSSLIMNLDMKKTLELIISQSKGLQMLKKKKCCRQDNKQNLEKVQWPTHDLFKA